ncbi:hypothetical protein JYK02_36830 [Corallococcus macrosporus]|uniref:Uncharacterized protein n=1 Tax=Corallococcus macrosporus TaxID=35 RepID=A0ABS3DP29_9BACT|nr:hypothetical protein [Corallococcus macrosporus]MBN8233095.1 hypothetical protein [Corallococcus macrosporus]
MRAGPPAEAVGTLPRARRHLAWVLVLARWLKAWAERVLAEHSAALAKAAAGLGSARVRSLPLREPPVTPPPSVPLWPSWRESPLPPVPRVTHSAAHTPRLNTLQCIPRDEWRVPVEAREDAPLNATPRVPFGFDPDDLLPAEPVAVVAPMPSPALLLQAAAREPPPAAQPSQAVTSFPRDPARELLTLLKESLGTRAPPSVPWSEPVPPSPAEPADAEEMLRQCERLELEPSAE